MNTVQTYNTMNTPAAQQMLAQFMQNNGQGISLGKPQPQVVKQGDAITPERILSNATQALTLPVRGLGHLTDKNWQKQEAKQALGLNTLDRMMGKQEVIEQPQMQVQNAPQINWASLMAMQ